jgi:hypothetical protein
MEAILKQLCEEHGLTSVGINIFSNEKMHFAVYLHWGALGCISGSGETFDEALANALTNMSERRAVEAALGQFAEIAA